MKIRILLETRQIKNRRLLNAKDSFVYPICSPREILTMKIIMYRNRFPVSVQSIGFFMCRSNYGSCQYVYISLRSGINRALRTPKYPREKGNKYFCVITFVERPNRASNKKVQNCCLKCRYRSRNMQRVCSESCLLLPYI